MKVLYTSSLWSKAKGVSGLSQKINWQFENLGLKRCIPKVYHFNEGIVFDLLTFLDESEVKAFFEKYAAIEDQLTPLQQQCAEQEHPYKEINIRDIWIDGKKIDEGCSSSASSNIPFAGENRELLPVQEAYRSSLDGITYFNCQRFCVPYPKTNSAVEKFLRALGLGRIKTLKLITHEQRRFYPIDIHLELSVENDHKSISVIHPETGITHTMYFQLYESFEIPQHDLQEKQRLYAVAANYEIEPPLSPHDLLQFDTSLSYSSLDDYGSTSATAIGIIGGADGPTAIFPSKNSESDMSCGPHGLPLHICLSRITLEKNQAAQFVLRGVYTKVENSKTYCFKK